MQERRDDRFAHVIVLTIRIQSACRTERRVGSRASGISERTGCSDDGNRRFQAESVLHAEWHEDGSNDWNRREA